MDLILQFIPIVNLVQDFIQASGASAGVSIPPQVWEWAVSFWSTVMVIQYVILPAWQKIAKLTPWKWDDNLPTRGLALVGRVVKLALSVVAVDPALLQRFREIQEVFQKKQK